jgi:aerobic-type carbon monoxide dehydrogenase small subunit (CoxS/CutS family)
MQTIFFHLNGRETTLEAEVEMPLVYALRNDLGLRGTRLGCGEGQCASCTVLVNSRPVTSCTTPVAAVAGRHVETVESLAQAETPHPLLVSFIREQAGQCGYCLSGILMRAKALLSQDTRPSRAAIVESLNAHICRCGAHARIVRAIEHAADLMAEGSVR